MGSKCGKPQSSYPRRVPRRSIIQSCQANIKGFSNMCRSLWYDSETTGRRVKSCGATIDGLPGCLSPHKPAVLSRERSVQAQQSHASFCVVVCYTLCTTLSNTFMSSQLQSHIYALRLRTP